VRRATAASLLALAFALGACSTPARPSPTQPPQPPQQQTPPPSLASTLGWLPAELVTAVRAPAAGAPMLAFFARSPRRPPCVDVALGGVRETLQLQRARGARMALVLVGALDRDQLEACGALAARALLNLEVTVRREGALTVFEGGGGAQVAGFAEGRAVLADTADEVNRVLHPPRVLGPADPLGSLLPWLAAASELAPGELAAITTIDYVAPWTKLSARGTTLRLVRQSGLRAETRVRYSASDEARRARDTLSHARAGGRADVPFNVRRALALLEFVVDGPDLVIDLAPLLSLEHAALLQSLLEELASSPRTP
jgi:hypothetical protein